MTLPDQLFTGKRRKVMRNVIRIPVTQRYRLLCHDNGEQIIPMKVVSHETYNNLYRNAKQLISSIFKFFGGAAQLAHPKILAGVPL